MGKLIKLNNLDKEELEKILSEDLIVIEDVQGSKIWVNWNGEEFTIKPKSLSNEPINLIDLAMQKYYNKASEYLKSFDSRVKSLINKNYNFCFEYFPDESPGNIEYNRIPKNNLVLTAINKSGKFDFNLEELEEYARLFDVDLIPVIYQGKMTDKMIEAIKYFINTSEEDLEYIFGEKSFSFFFYKILNPLSDNSFLMTDDFNKNIEKLIIRSNNNDISFELLNPLYKKLNFENKTEFVEVYTLILLNFLNFCQSINIYDIKLKGNRRDEIYIHLICKLFNIYMSEVKNDLINFDFTVPEFYDKDKFKINVELINNKLTLDYINEDGKLEYIFKIILSSFKNKRKKAIGIFTENTVVLFNNFVDDINNHIGKYLKQVQEQELTRKGLIDFSEFLDLEYDIDGDGKVYPDIYDDFEKDVHDKKKKDGGKIDISSLDMKKPLN